ncbi:hypothetical protein [Marinobacter sp. UBA2678]|uniref:hypothetical protein n=1 Tax=Marinobacter sp. UBA2678 TaxID=1946815 RepID=UPI000C092CF9|nr:hypothetical protein [Marinobacter sp. UBA2678]MAM85753.1 hypothetical protein [Hahellaceae bacterium]|tara:strand:- start:3486 stop:4010 length:525 start_codon:yes stop_codon:yes gene_type:complete
MQKCDCLNFCGDDTNIDPYSESCVDYHNRRTAALKWLADYVPCWDQAATHIMRCSWHAVGYLFFSEAIGKPHQGFLFSLEELNRERVRIGKTAFTDIRQQMKQHQAQIDYLQPTCGDATIVLAKCARELRISHTIAGSWAGVEEDIKDEYDYMLALAERLNKFCAGEIAGGGDA